MLRIALCCSCTDARSFVEGKRAQLVIGAWAVGLKVLDDLCF